MASFKKDSFALTGFSVFAFDFGDQEEPAIKGGGRRRRRQWSDVELIEAREAIARAVDAMTPGRKSSRSRKERIDDVVDAVMAEALSESLLEDEDAILLLAYHFYYEA